MFHRYLAFLKLANTIYTCNSCCPLSLLKKREYIFLVCKCLKALKSLYLYYLFYL